MTSKRSIDQAVDAFSAPKELLRAAQLEAKRRGMTKSGFYRYCLALELNYSEAEAEQFARYQGSGNFSVLEPPVPRRSEKPVHRLQSTTDEHARKSDRLSK